MLAPRAVPPGLAAKRMAKERQELEKASSQEKDQDYFVVFRDDNLFEFDAYVIAPDTIYRYRLVRLHFEIPKEYPLKPPKVKFIQHTGDRIHPNFYVEGKVCLSILGTWAGEPWAFGMTCHTVLITIRSLFDDEPYRHEPGGQNDPEYNRWVEYSSWKPLLLDYLARETNPGLRVWLDTYVHKNGEAMLRELSRQQDAARAITSNREYLTSPYPGSRPGRAGIPRNYPALIQDLRTAVLAARYRVNKSAASNSSQPPPVLHGESAPKRKADHHQASTKAGASGTENEEAGTKRAKPSASTKRPPTEIIDLT